MIRSLLTLLTPGLLLVSCDKPGETTTRKTGETAAARGRHAPLSPTPDTPAALRTILRAAVDIESPAAREKALADIAWTALEMDPVLANEAFQQLPAGCTEKIRLIQHYAMRLAEQDPDEALKWAASLGSEPEIAAAHAQIALVVSETDPQRAGNLLSESGIAGHEFDVAVVQVIQRWAAKSTPDAAVWVSSFPPGAAREAGIKIIVDQWAKADAQAAFVWISSLQDETVRKEAALAMEESILQQPQSVRDAWLAHADTKIQSELEQQREQAIQTIGNNIPPSTTSSSER